MGKGGARIGAGRPGWRIKDEECLRLNVLALRRAGLLRPGVGGVWCWDQGVRSPSGRIETYAVPGGLCLLYRLRGAIADQMVNLSATACPFGGSRQWFQCPRCRRRAGLLYLRPDGEGFGCRHCEQVACTSQAEGELDRAWRRLAKVRSKLPDPFSKPRGMHRTTFERLRLDYFTAKDQAQEAWAEALASALSAGG